MFTHDNLAMAFADPVWDERLTHHSEAIRRAAVAFAQAILDNTSQGPDQQSAIRYVKIAMLLAESTLGGNG